MPHILERPRVDMFGVDFMIWIIFSRVFCFSSIGVVPGVVAGVVAGVVPIQKKITHWSIGYFSCSVHFNA